MLPEALELVHGPGCPVCVLPMGRVDDCVAISDRPKVIFTTVGTAPFRFVAEYYKKPLVISGFEPLDILQSIWMVPRQLEQRRGEIENEYARIISPAGNAAAFRAVAQVYELREFYGAASARSTIPACVPASLARIAAYGDRLAFTTDSYVVDPLFFPGDDIGRLAVCGTVNDLAVGGAVPLYFILRHHCRRRSAGRGAAPGGAINGRWGRQAGVAIATDDTKIVPKGACEKLFVTTSGIGVIRRGLELGVHRAPSDAVLINGRLGDHGAAILAARRDLALETPIASDCAALHRLIGGLLEAAAETRCLRDATRGGATTVLNDIARASRVAIETDDALIQMHEAVRGFCEILGLRPLYLANEAKIIAVVRPISAMRRSPQCGAIRSAVTPH
jgi:hydrogenase expression/formation protein HypE